jgi:putative endopeptidase
MRDVHSCHAAYAQALSSIRKEPMTLFRKAAPIVICALTIFLAVAAAPGQNVNTEDIDRSVKPGDDFYRYANGAWLQKSALPAGMSSYGTSAMLAQKTSQRVNGLIRDAAKDRSPKDNLSQKVGAYYSSFMDENAIEAEGWKPLADEMAAISAIRDKTSLSAYLGSTLNTEADGLTGNADHVFGAWVNQSFTDSTRYVFHLLQGGLGMPDRNAYIDPSPKMAALREQYRSHIAATLKLANIADAEARAAGVLSLEIRIAQSHAPDEDAADVFKQNNPWKRADFNLKAPGMDWNAYFAAAGLAGEPEFIAWQPSAVTGASALVAHESIDAWKNYLTFHLIEHYASVLPSALRAEDFAFYGKTLSGTEQMPERGKAAIAATNAALGQAVGQLYTRRYFPPQAKTKAQAMVANLITAYRARISNLTWMSPATKEKALAKLAALKIGAGYPDQWIDYSTLKIVAGDAFGNMRRAEAFNRTLNLAKLKRAADPGEWRIDPQIVGAVILFSPNTETFSAGILQAPYFDSQGDDASNYGSAGAGIAHEISHSFDGLGNIYDAQGRLGNWWTADDLAKYHAAGARLSKQLEGYCPRPDLCVNGKQVLSESIADLAGLLVAHDAYVLSRRGKRDAIINGLTGEQRFFLAFSQRWRKLETEAALQRQIQSDIHLPGEYRSDAVRNVDAWYKAFDIGPGDKLYLEPQDRVRIW